MTARGAASTVAPGRSSTQSGGRVTVSSPKRQAPLSIDPYAQNGFGVRFEWGANGAAAISAGASAMIVVDVLSSALVGLGMYWFISRSFR